MRDTTHTLDPTFPPIDVAHEGHITASLRVYECFKLMIEIPDNRLERYTVLRIKFVELAGGHMVGYYVHGHELTSIAPCRYGGNQVWVTVGKHGTYTHYRGGTHLQMREACMKHTR